MSIADFSTTTLKAVQANTLAAIASQVANLNESLKSDYKTKFDGWAQSITAGRSFDTSTAPAPPNAYVVGYFTDPTTGPGSVGPYAGTPVQWAFPSQTGDPVCAPFPLPEVHRPFVAPVLPEPANVRNVPQGDTMPVGYVLTAPDGGKWQKQASPTPFGMAYYYEKVS